MKFKENLDRQKVINAINSKLDKRIRVVSLRMVSQSFNVKNFARSRHYEYLLPMDALKCQEKLSTLTEEEIIEKVDQKLQLFVGTKNYHNYTVKMKATDNRAKRFMLKLETKKFEWNGKVLVKICLHGQSFVYHQIRKMVGAILQTLISPDGEDLIENSFALNKFKIWLAPSSGLLLEKVRFLYYKILIKIIFRSKIFFYKIKQENFTDLKRLFILQKR